MKKYINLLIISVIFLIKSIYYYHLVDLQHHMVIATLITTLIFFTTYLLIKNKNYFLIGLLIINSLMVINITYYHYFNDYISVQQLDQIGMITDVTSSVLAVFQWHYLLIFLDILLIKFSIDKKNWSQQLKSTLAISSFILLIVLVLNPSSYSSIKSVSNQEFFSYHLKDVYHSVNDSTKSVESPIDESIPETNKTKNVNTKPNYFGIGNNRNLIVIQVESLQEMMLNQKYNHQEITPYLNQLIAKDSFYFNNYYQQLGKGNTSDAEFVSHNSIHAPISNYAYKTYADNDYYGLVHHLKDAGYTTSAMHGYYKEFWNRYKAYPGQGFDEFISEEDFTLDESIGMGLSDGSFFDQSLHHLKTLEMPFYAFMVTLTNHNPYKLPDKYKKIEVLKDDKNTLFGNYIHTVHYTDQQIGKFIKGLKENNLYENSMIVIYGDHFGINSELAEVNENVSRFLGKDYDYDEMLNIPLIIHIPNSNINKKLSITGGQIDFMPTLLNILGLKNKNPLTQGSDLLNTNDNLVAFQTYLLKGSFIKKEIIFEISRDGVFKHSHAWNKKTGNSIKIDTLKDDYTKAFKEINLSHQLLKANHLKNVLETNNFKSNSSKQTDALEPSPWISQAGGRIDNKLYTNALEAINNSVEEGYNFIELDFNWTSDNELVLIHDWGNLCYQLFNVTPGQPYTYEEYKNFKMINGWQQLTLKSLAKWLKDHPDVYIVTDIKDRNIKGLSLIKEKYPKISNQLIPQIYNFEEYIKVKYLGFDKQILTLYASDYSDQDILNFVKRNDVFALAMPTVQAKTDLVKKLDQEDVFIYTHTINSYNKVKVYQDFGIDGFYTDDLLLK